MKKFKMPKHPFGKKPPKAMKDAVKMTLHLQDEMPRIGCGHRLVWVKVSRKWTYVCDLGGNRSKLPTVRFQQLTRSARYE